MAEALPQFATLTTRNLIVDDPAIILSVTSQQSLFPKENLYSPLWSKPFRSASSSVQWQLVGQFKQPSLPTIVAIKGSNLASGKAVTWEIADDQVMTTNKQTWNFTTYAQDWNPKTRTGRAVLRWYPGTPDAGGSGITPRSFFRLTIAANATIDSDGDGVADPYIHIGALYLGNYVRLPVTLGLEREIDDPSGGSVSDGGAEFPDRRPTRIRLSSEAPLMDDTSSVAMLSAVQDAGTTRHCLLDQWGWATTTSKKAESCIYGFLGSGMGDTAGKFTRYVKLFDRFSHDFREARA